MNTDTATPRRRPPASGDLNPELRTLLAAAGLPCAEPDADRTRAVGFQITSEPGGSAVLEWFVSQSARAAAATEQAMGIPYGDAIVLHGEARRHLHSAAFGFLGALGYSCEWTESQQGIRVNEQRRQGPTTLAADVRRVIGELGRFRTPAQTVEAQSDSSADAADGEQGGE